MLNEVHLPSVEQPGDILAPARYQVVDADHLAAEVKQAATEVRPDEASAPADEGTAGPQVGGFQRLPIPR